MAPLWFLLPILALCQYAADASILATPQTLTPVSCPSNQTTFVSLTEMVLEGRSSLLDTEERTQLTQTFQQIYNSLTQRSCDSYFRRIAQLSWVSMSNGVGETMVMSNATGLMPMEMDMNTNISDSNSTTRRLQASNFTAVPEINLVYQVTGTCRNCPVSRRGSFELYDDTFRRRLGQSTLGNGIRLRQLSSTVTVSVDVSDALQQQQEGERATSLNLDCRCVQGTTPTQPQPPGVQECVDEMNLQFEALRANSEGELFEDIAMTDLLQPDDDTEEEDEDGAVDVEFDSGVNDVDTVVERTGSVDLADAKSEEKEPSLSEAILEEGMQNEPIAASSGNIATIGSVHCYWTCQSTLPWSVAGLCLLLVY